MFTTISECLNHAVVVLHGFLIHEILTLDFMFFLGLQIIFTLDEVSFIQNLVFYIEEAYRTPVRLWFKENSRQYIPYQENF